MKTLFLNKKYVRGGVGNYYRVIRNQFVDAHFMDISYSQKKYGVIEFLKKYIFFIRQFRSLIKHETLKIVVFNPSLGKVALYRDYIYHIMATRSKKKQIIFFRGWNDDFAEMISSNRFPRVLFNHIYKKRADAFIVLSERFKDKLIEWGVNQPVYVETTIVEEKMLNRFDFKKKFFGNNQLLFLSRIEKDKGIFEAVDAVNILMKQNRKLQFTIAGNGSAFEDLKTHVSNLDTDRITLKGYVKGEEKTGCFSSANIFLFPSVHGEGMPNSILEAMAFGLSVLTTRVGGIPDFFEEGKMGLFLESREPEHIAEKIEYLLDRPELMKEMSRYNYEYAKEHFYASKVAARLVKIIDDVVEEKA